MKYQLEKSQIDIDDVPCAALYRLNIDYFPSAIIACFIISDGWDVQALLELKEKAEADILVGLQTDDQDYESLDIIEAVIKCQLDEVNDVVDLLDVKSASTIIGIDVTDIKSLFECGGSFQFVQTSATGDPELDIMKEATHKLISLLAKAHNTKGMFVGMQSVQSLPLESLASVTEAVEGLLSNDAVSIYYSSNMSDELNNSRLKAIYVED